MANKKPGKPRLSPRDEAVVAVAESARIVAELARGLVPAVYEERRHDPVCYMRDVLTIRDKFLAPLLVRAVIASRECGATWEQIGEAAGMTRQSAHEKWAPDEAAWAASGRRGHSRGEPVDALRNAAGLDEWYARGRDGSDGIVTGPRGVRAVTDGLDATDRPQRDWEEDRPERPATVAAMRAALAHYSDHEWGDRPLRYLLAYPPVDLLADAMEWGWSDPRVREHLVDALARHLTHGRYGWPTDGDDASRDLVLTEMIAGDRRYP
ncbi:MULTISPECIES: hypothetical protein [Streptomyces]|uniref:hypothetical protein n=1 Tax=Streptomyces TaxID=1883 RepID=UPI0022578981|nr:MULTISPECIES: hypothetical protein [Streptomyces]MCX5278143.1 hypothetical protein [Streptomyces virginiae]